MLRKHDSRCCCAWPLVLLVFGLMLFVVVERQPYRNRDGYARDPGGDGRGGELEAEDDELRRKREGGGSHASGDSPSSKREQSARTVVTFDCRPWIDLVLCSTHDPAREPYGGKRTHAVLVAPLDDIMACLYYRPGSLASQDQANQHPAIQQKTECLRRYANDFLPFAARFKGEVIIREGPSTFIGRSWPQIVRASPQLHRALAHVAARLQHAVNFDVHSATFADYVCAPLSLFADEEFNAKTKHAARCRVRYPWLASSSSRVVPPSSVGGERANLTHLAEGGAKDDDEAEELTDVRRIRHEYPPHHFSLTESMREAGLFDASAGRCWYAGKERFRCLPSVLAFGSSRELSEVMASWVQRLHRAMRRATAPTSLKIFTEIGFDNHDADATWRDEYLLKSRPLELDETVERDVFVFDAIYGEEDDGDAAEAMTGLARTLPGNLGFVLMRGDPAMEAFRFFLAGECKRLSGVGEDTCTASYLESKLLPLVTGLSRENKIMFSSTIEGAVSGKGKSNVGNNNNHNKRLETKEMSVVRRVIEGACRSTTFSVRLLEAQARATRAMTLGSEENIEKQRRAGRERASRIAVVFQETLDRDPSMVLREMARLAGTSHAPLSTQQASESSTDGSTSTNVQLPRSTACKLRKLLSPCVDLLASNLAASSPSSASLSHLGEVKVLGPLPPWLVRDFFRQTC